MDSMSSRLEILQGMLAQDPANTFARYGLAMEFANSGDYAGAVKQFEELVAAKPDYCAAYFHGGQTLEKMGELERAAAMYRRGIDAATKAGDSHTRKELEGALAMLP
jgi:tetratricopeptide (TPR) repeat protein